MRRVRVCVCVLEKEMDQVLTWLVTYEAVETC